MTTPAQDANYSRMINAARSTTDPAHTVFLSSTFGRSHSVTWTLTLLTRAYEEMRLKIRKASRQMEYQANGIVISWYLTGQRALDLGPVWMVTTDALQLRIPTQASISFMQTCISIPGWY